MQEISIEEARTIKNIQLIDIRSRFVFQKGHVHNAKNIPLEELEERILELDKKKPVYLLCYHGHSSQDAAAFLNEQGFNAFSIKEGTEGWKHHYPEEIIL